jgi:short-subunit dehydrogenase
MLHHEVHAASSEIACGRRGIGAIDVRVKKFAPRSFLVGILSFLGICAVLRFLWYLYKIFIAYFRSPRNLKSLGINWVLVTGASSPVGRSLSLLCASQGVNVAGVGCDSTSLDDVKSACTAKGVEFLPVIADLTSQDSAASIFDQVSSYDVRAMFVCHGTGTAQRFDQLTEQDLLKYNTSMITTNVLLAKHFSKKTNETGTITYLSSLCSYAWLPFWTSYGAATRFLNHFVHNFQLEVRDLTVQIVNPGQTRAPNAEGPVWALSSDRVAEMILATVNTNFDVDVGIEAVGYRFVYWLLPQCVLDRLLRREALAHPPS